MNDVLAEIRRLVTEEERGRRRESTETAGPLILTREMRVDVPGAAPDSVPPLQEAPEEIPETGLTDEAVETGEAGWAAETDEAPAPSESPATPAPPGNAPVAESPDPAEAEFDAHVRAIVRAELEGALGDRISANLRKIIRREVTRALNARLGE